MCSSGVGGEGGGGGGEVGERLRGCYKESDPLSGSCRDGCCEGSGREECQEGTASDGEEEIYSRINAVTGINSKDKTVSSFTDGKGTTMDITGTISKVKDGTSTGTGKMTIPTKMLTHTKIPKWKNTPTEAIPDARYDLSRPGMR